MHKLDPIERLPDGSLFRLTPGQLRSVRGLTKRCCNFLDGGGLLLDEVEDDFQFKGCPGLYFVGETLDCAGSCGGFNLHWAFGSGLVAGRSAAGHAAAGRALPKASAPAKSRKKPHR